MSTNRSQAPGDLLHHEEEFQEAAVTETLVEGVFREVEWPGSNLNGHNAQGADFSAAILTGICALGTNFAGALFEETQLQGAALCGANLTGAMLRHANLQNANLMWCDLRSASLFGADLRGANLAWADLREVDLREANLSGAYFNYHTQWPRNFNPRDAAMFELAEPR
ncbi:MAG TPA: pentapeptide repeat-containing protein [Caldilineaceae bacterium]|nr:pentapeptide repeat-containing protein [Caldilineaceae bacterium]